VSGVSASALVPILIVVFVILPIDFWVYADAKVQQGRGRPVVLSSGRFQIGTPEAWFVGCLLLWIVFFPLYVIGRSR
jgi:hypothetical protein